jgi:hypothetical protein
MADSEISTSLSTVTRRRLLAGTALAIAIWPHQAGADPRNPPAMAVFDPALALWRDWRVARCKTLSACRRQQRLERVLLERMRCRRGRTGTLAGEGAVGAKARGDDVVLPAGGCDHVDAGKNAKAGRASCQDEWDAEDRRIGYSEARRAECVAADREQAVLELLMGSSATTLAGILGKLDAVICEGAPSDDSGEFPWPQLRGVWEDLKRVGQVLQPDMFADREFGKAISDKRELGVRDVNMLDAISADV